MAPTASSSVDAAAAASTRLGDSSVCGEAIDGPDLIKSAPKTQAVIEAKRDLIRQALFEDLDAVRLYVETALLLIEARDDFGTIYAIDRGAAHYRTIIGAKKELGSLREGTR